MNKRFTQGFILSLFSLSNAYAQIDPAKLPAVAKFIPVNYTILKFAIGNLNNDKWDDMILVLNKKGEENYSTQEHPLKRRLILLIGQPDNSFKRAVESENIVYYYNYDPNFKDAFVDLNIKQGMFSIDHYGGFAQRWGRTTVFNYNSSDKKWYLTKDEYSTFESTDAEKTTKEKTYTVKDFGKVTVDKFDIYKAYK